MVVTESRADAVEGGAVPELYARHAAAAVRLAYLLTGDRALAQDILQEAFVRVVGRFHDLRNRDSFEWYLRRVVVNLANSHFRRLKVERAYLRREARAPAAASVEAPDVETREELWWVLQSLPERQRTAIVLRFYEGLSEAQTAEVLRCPVGTVKSLVSRG